MAAQQDTTIVPPRSEGPPHLVVHGDEETALADDSHLRTDGPRREESLLARFLNNLRIALSVPHT